MGPPHSDPKILIEVAVKTTEQILDEKAMFDNSDKTDEVLNDYVTFNEKRRG